MTTIGENAHFIRSKNAGPFWITIDVFCGTKEKFGLISRSKSLAPEVIANVYHVSPENVKVFFLPNINVIKISYPRLLPQGSKYERDTHAGQQYAQLGDLPV